MEGSGGAIFYTCDRDNLDCRLELGLVNSFFGNKAEIQGGAIYWNVNIPIIASTTEYNNNWAR